MTTSFLLLLVPRAVQAQTPALNASSSAYELTTTTLSGIGQESSGTQLSPAGGASAS